MKHIFIVIFLVSCIVSCKYKTPPNDSELISETIKLNNSKTTQLIKPKGATISDRVLLPEGFKRVAYPKGSFQSYLRNYALKPFGTKIINYDKTEYYWQKGHIGILDISVPENGLQQCADALIRIRSEYLWENNQKEAIGFNFTSGHYCSWINYAEGFRPNINGRKVTFHKAAQPNHSKTNFYKYLNLIYMYSGTLSLYNELESIKLNSDIQLGDMLILGGSPGHIMMVCDEIVNQKGEKKYLLFQGNTPAQSVHLVKNLEDSVFSPWYSLKIDNTIPVSNFTFSSAKFVRFK